MQNKISFLSISKKLFKRLWTFIEMIKIIFNYFFVSSNYPSTKPKIHYGGSRKGGLGGPSVKTKKLNQTFPEYNWNFNIIYLLSNSIYLNPLACKLIKKKGLPIVLNQNGVYYPAWFEGNWEKENNKMSRIYCLADYVLWQSKFCKRACEKFLGKRIGIGEILYNSVDTSIFVPKNKENKKRFSFLITGNIRRKSNYRISSVLLAIKEITREDSNVELIIAGYIEDRKYFYSMIRDLKIQDHIIFQETYSQKDAPKIYQLADAYITMSYQDNCPTAVLEAMACGLPILYSNSGGIPELVDKESGLGINVKGNWNKTIVPSPSEISNGMQKIIDNRITMSQSSRIRSVEFFDIKIWLNKHQNIFEKLLQS